MARCASAFGLTILPLLLCGAVPASARTPSAAATRAASRVALTLRLAGGRHQFHPGEIIPIELVFTSTIPRRFFVDGTANLRGIGPDADRFRLEPRTGVTDPMLDMLASDRGRIGSVLGSGGLLDGGSYAVALDLNEWFRFDRSGAYTLSILSRRVTDRLVSEEGHPAVVPLESNSVSFEILPHDSAWEAADLASAQEMLDGDPADPEHRAACRILRFLGTNAAVDSLARRYGADSRGGCDFEYRAGLFGAPDRRHVIAQMEDRLRAPEQAVTPEYLRTLCILSVYLAHPELRPPQTPEMQGRSIAGGAITRRPDLIETAASTYLDDLANALPAKSRAAEAITLAGLFRIVTNQRPLAPAVPFSKESLRDRVAGSFLDLPLERQRDLLEGEWADLAAADMEPVLRPLVEAPASNADARRLADLALRRLYEVDRDEGRLLILREINDPPAAATLGTLGLLPDLELPDLDEVLADNLETALRRPVTAGNLDALAIRAELLQPLWVARRTASRQTETRRRWMTAKWVDASAAGEGGRRLPPFPRARQRRATMHGDRICGTPSGRFVAGRRALWYNSYHDCYHGCGWASRDSARDPSRGGSRAGRATRRALARRRDRDRTPAAGRHARAQRAPPRRPASNGGAAVRSRHGGAHAKAALDAIARMSAEAFAVDSSGMVAAVCTWHQRHVRALTEINGRFTRGERLVVAAHALVEAYAVLTRLPAPHRLAPADAWTLIKTNFVDQGTVAALDGSGYVALVSQLASRGIAGGRSYDEIIATCTHQAKAAALLTLNPRHFEPPRPGMTVVDLTT